MEIIGKIKRLAERFNFTLNTHNYLSFQVFREDFTLCLMLGDFLSDPILSDSPDLTLSIYGDSDQFRTARLSAMHLHLAEGHVLGQVSASLRLERAGYDSTKNILIYPSQQPESLYSPMTVGEKLKNEKFYFILIVRL